jgi:hypothetical protein
MRLYFTKKQGRKEDPKYSKQHPKALGKRYRFVVHAENSS